MDIALNSTGDDMAYEAGSLSTVTEIDEIKQSLLIALRTGLGEWMFDTSAGVAYRGIVRTSAPKWPAVEAEIRRVCGGVDGVTKITSVRFDHNRATRSLTIYVDVRTIYGDTAVAVSA